jgi:hypothetical protein
MLHKLVQFLMALLLLNSVASANDIGQLDGDWYSYKWKYGYSLNSGKGIAFATNSPNFKLGQEIVRLTAVGKNSFVGENIYKDGKFYKVKATLQPDGKLLFEGEKNVKWEMEKIDPETYSSIVNSKPGKQEKGNDINTAESESTDYTRLPSYIVGMCLGFISKDITVRGRENVDARHMRYLKSKNKSASEVSNFVKNYPQCFEGGVMIADCLQAKNVNAKGIGLVLGYNTGVTNYKDPTDRATMSVGCME